MQSTVDFLAWFAASGLAWLVLVDSAPDATDFLVAAAASVVLQLILGFGLLLYRERYRYGSFAEFGALALSTAVIAAALLVTTAGDVPFVLLLASSALLLMAGSRYLVRLGYDAAQRPLAGEPVLIIGAGCAGQSLIGQMVADPDGAYLPVGIIEDEPRKRHLRICGVPVSGTSDEVAEVARRLGVAGAIIAIADTDAAFVQKCRDQLAGTGCWLRTIPPLPELVDRRVEIADIRDIRVEDLIGRSSVRTDLSEIADTIRGRRVLVTGAGGSIGSELCRQLAALEPANLIMLDRDESALHAVELAIFGSALLTSSDTVLADIRDPEALARIFADSRPDIVFHAAALKHLPMLQRFPQEAWKTNVHGTLNVLRAAQTAGVATFINISTDKAAAPTSELGRSKRVAERLVSEFARCSTGTYLSVRFGNVLGSRGSVLLAFQEQIRQGLPLTVTDPEVRRYFMTIPEACQLVLQAAAIGQDGFVMVLDMGEPVKIVDIARNLIAMSNRDAEIVFTGLREGEKLDEELFGDYEGTVVRIHEKISRVAVPELAVSALPPADAPTEVIGEFCDLSCMALLGAGADVGPLPDVGIETIPGAGTGPVPHGVDQGGLRLGAVRALVPAPLEQRHAV
ncbi:MULTISPECIES: nucleoside-diphosphate sugar epimerase/dehydratase [Brevibacterium]|uniref:nucleoside-diphosphate sugar epimerase/dehydratase n=1 Tax=Brevibacterium TaxID=1696 RepID=UPI0015F093F0|nr:MULTISPECIES: nucleoside-diphosphate sugar epimerase/dehydratase [Brevibacterium]